VLTLKMTLGLFEEPFVDVGRAGGLLEDDRALAYEAALASLTLLENDGTLPLSAGLRIVVTGGSATSVANQMGGWTIGWQGIERPTEVPPAVTVLDGLSQRAPAGTVVTHVDGRARAAAAEAARDADVVVAVVGEGPYAEGQGDVTSLALDRGHLALLQALVDTGTPVVAVLVSGRPLTLPDDLRHALAGLVMAYLPGSEAGSAVADALYGNAGFSGRLPFAWPAHQGAAGARAAPPVYPFGHGLGTTRFAVDDPTAEVGGETVRVTLSLTNVGAVPGRETVQVFAEPSATGAPPRLVAFTRVDLAPGETRLVTLAWPLDRLAVGSERRVESGTYGLRVGEARAVIAVP
jgi:beta-glucosidase